MSDNHEEEPELSPGAPGEPELTAEPEPVGEQAPEPAAEEAEEQAPEPAAEEVEEPEPAPVAAEVEEQAPAPVAEEVEEQAPAPVAEEAEEQAPAPVAEAEEPAAAAEAEGEATEPEPAAAEAEPELPPGVPREPELTAEPEPVGEAQPQAEAPASQGTGAEEEPEEIEIAPRVRPEIPGADLEPDIMPEAEQYLDAEAQAAAEAEAEAEAERARAEAEDERSRPIADAAIDLAAGARYTSTGKRKTAVARVILKPGAGEYSINGRSLEEFFPRETLQRMIRQPLETVGYESRMDVVARMHGGGVSAQAGALRHGISRALIVADPHLRGELKRRGFLTRDPRVKERKKAGLKKARKRPQFSKR